MTEPMQMRTRAKTKEPVKEQKGGRSEISTFPKDWHSVFPLPLISGKTLGKSFHFSGSLWTISATKH